MKRYISLAVMALTIIGCSGGSPTEPNNKPATLYGTAYLCAYNNGTITVQDLSGHRETTAINNDWSFSFGYVFSVGEYHAYANKVGLPEQTLSYRYELKTGLNTLTWSISGCPTIDVSVDTNCSAVINGPADGAISTTSGWTTSNISILPNSTVYGIDLPLGFNSYRLLFNATKKDGTKWQWDYPLTPSTRSFNMWCGPSGSFRATQIN